MDNLTTILFLCATMPLLPALNVLPDKRSRLFLGYMLLGMVVCLIASEVNVWMLSLCGGDRHYASTNITPMVEEILKALPVLYYALVFSDERDTLLSISCAMGLGFALLENMWSLMSNLSDVTILWAFMRGFGAARMHSMCTTMIGRGISHIRKRRKLFYCGTFALLIYAIIFHALFNTLILDEHRWLAYAMVLVINAPTMMKFFRTLFPGKQGKPA